MKLNNLDTGTTILKLSNREIETIDLEPLRELDRLERLELQNNKISSLDLSPLEGMQSLRILYLWNNPLGEIDLSVCSTLPNLTEIGLSKTKLKNIDLSPLEGCVKLKTIGFWLNKIESLDLTPISGCKSLTGIWFNQNPIRSIDISPLIACPNIKKIGRPGGIEIRSIFGKEFLSFIKKDRIFWSNTPDQKLEKTDYRYLLRAISAYEETKTPWYSIALAHEIIRKLGYNWVGLLDNSVELVKQILGGKKNESTLIPNALKKQIDRGGTTIGLDLDEVLNYSDIVSKLPRILELRQKEIENISVGKAIKYANLKPLWLTAYGNQVLSALKCGVKCTTDELLIIEKTFDKLGIAIDIKRSKDIEFPANISNELQEFIFRWNDFKRNKSWAT